LESSVVERQKQHFSKMRRWQCLENAGLRQRNAFTAKAFHWKIPVKLHFSTGC
jgi:hypothetical protein